MHILTFSLNINHSIASFDVRYNPYCSILSFEIFHFLNPSSKKLRSFVRNCVTLDLPSILPFMTLSFLIGFSHFHFIWNSIFTFPGTLFISSFNSGRDERWGTQLPSQVRNAWILERAVNFCFPPFDWWGRHILMWKKERGKNSLPTCICVSFCFVHNRSDGLVVECNLRFEMLSQSVS